MRQRLCFVGLWVALASSGLAQVNSPESPAFWLSRAQSDAGGLNDPAEKAGVLTSIGFEWSTGGDAKAAADAIVGAGDAASRIGDPLARFHAYMALASYADRYQDAGQTQQYLGVAQAAADAAEASPEKSAALNDLTNFRRAVAGIAPVLPDLNNEPDPAKRAQNLGMLAMNFAQAGPRHHDDYNTAVSMAATDIAAVRDPIAQGALQSMIVEAQVAAGDLDAAAATAKTIIPPASQAEAYGTLAEAYTQAGRKPDAQEAIVHMAAAATAAADDHRAAIWLAIARARQELDDSAGATVAVDAAAGASSRLEPADRADALAAAARLRCELGDTAGAAVLAGDAATAGKSVSDPSDIVEVQMAVAAAEARCGLGEAARRSIAAAAAAASNMGSEKRHPGGDPPPAAYLDVIQAAAAAGDFGTAQAIADGVSDPHLKHDAVLAIAQAQINLSQYQAAEDTVAKEGSVDTEAAVCGMIAASLARTRTPVDAEHWIARLSNVSDKVAARLAVAEVQMSKPDSPARPKTGT